MIGCFVFHASHPCCGSSCSRKETLSRRQDFIFSPPFVFPTLFPAVRNFKRKSCLTLGLCHALGLGFGSVAGDSKRSQSFCQKCGWQVTAKHTCTLCLGLCTKWHGAWLYGVHRTRRDCSSFMWHQPCQSCKHTTSVDIQKRSMKKLIAHV